MGNDSRGSRLAELASLADELNKVSDSLTGELRQVEQDLESLNLGVEAHGTIALERETLDEMMEDRDLAWAIVAEGRLAYGRHGGRWRILVRRFQVDQDDLGGGNLEPVDDFDRPLLDCSRDLRIRAVETGAVDELLGAIQQSAKGKLNALRSASEQLRNRS